MQESSREVILSKQEILDSLKIWLSIENKLLALYKLHYMMKTTLEKRIPLEIYEYIDKLIINLLDIYIIDKVKRCREMRIDCNVMDHFYVQCWFSKDYIMSELAELECDCGCNGIDMKCECV